LALYALFNMLCYDVDHPGEPEMIAEKFFDLALTLVAAHVCKVDRFILQVFWKENLFPLQDESSSVSLENIVLNGCRS